MSTPPKGRPKTKKRTTRARNEKCQYCGKAISSVSKLQKPQFHPACIEQAIADLLKTQADSLVMATLHAKATADQKQTSEKGIAGLMTLSEHFALYFRALVRLLIAKGLFTREELGALIKEIRVGEQVDDLLKDLESPEDEK